MKKTIITTLMVVLVAVPSWAVYSPPADRVVTWTGNVGIPGGIPDRPTEIDCTQAPYNVPTDGTSDCKTAITACLAGISSNQVAYLPAGTYNIQSDIVVPSNKVLRGAGMGNTNIVGKTPYTYTWGLIGFNQTNSFSTAVNISGSPAKGATTIDTAAAHNLSTGDYIIIDQLDTGAEADPPVTNVGDNGTCGWCGRTSGRSQGQVNRVASIPTSTQFTVEVPLYFGFATAQTPQVSKMNGVTVNAGVENLTLDNSVTQRDNALIMNYAAFSWFKNVELNYSKRIAILLIGYKNTIYGSVLHTTSLPLTSNSGYGIWAQIGASANLIENNVIYDLSNPIIINGAVSGNVFAYNYLHGHDGNTGRQNGAFSSHGGHPAMNLLEGNYMVGEVALDFTWGSSSHFTMFRNKMKLQNPLSTYAQYKFLAWYGQKNWYHSMIGNILWTTGDTGSYECSGTINTEVSQCVYLLGYQLYTQVDAATASTLLRHANYDYLNAAIQYNGADDHTLPNSLYLTEKPDWYVGTWPPADPSAPSMAVIPSEYYYINGSWPTAIPSSFTGGSMSGGVSIR